MLSKRCEVYRRSWLHVPSDIYGLTAVTLAKNAKYIKRLLFRLIHHFEIGKKLMAWTTDIS